MNTSDHITAINITPDLKAGISKIEENVYKVTVTRGMDTLLTAIFGYRETDVPRQAIAIAYRVLCHKRNIDDTIVAYRCGDLTCAEADELSRLDSVYTSASMEGRHTPLRPSVPASASVTKSSIPTPAGTINILERGEKDYPGVTLELIGNDGKSASAVMLEYNPALAAVELMAWTPAVRQDGDDPDIRRVMSPVKHVIYDSEVDLSDEAIEQARLDMEDGMTYSDEEMAHVLNERSSDWYDDEVANLSHGEKTLIPAGKKLIIFAELNRWDGTTYTHSFRSETHLSAILTAVAPMDHLVVYDDGKDVRAEANHHDGTNRYTFRLISNDKVTELKKAYALSKLSSGTFKPGTAPMEDWDRLISMTESLSPMVSAIYGWDGI